MEVKTLPFCCEKRIILFSKFKILLPAEKCKRFYFNDILLSHFIEVNKIHNFINF
jgi:hypothetical protein